MKFGVAEGASAQVAVVGVDAPLVVGAAMMSPAASAAIAMPAMADRLRIPLSPIALPCYSAARVTAWPCVLNRPSAEDSVNVTQLPHSLPK